MFFKFGDLDSTKPSGSIKIRVETIVHYMAKYSGEIVRKKMGWLAGECPLEVGAVPHPNESAERKPMVKAAAAG